MPVVIERQSPATADARLLIAELDEILNPLYPQESRHGYSVDKLLQEGVAFFILRQDRELAGCGGVKLFEADYGEVKRMYVRPQFRGLGLGRRMLAHLAEYARQQGVMILRLETGIYQGEAIRLYERYGFQRIPPFGDYREDPLSLYYELTLHTHSRNTEDNNILSIEYRV